jgi:hypothetical protein
MRLADKLQSKRYGIPGIILMEMQQRSAADYISILLEEQ